MWPARAIQRGSIRHFSRRLRSYFFLGDIRKRCFPVRCACFKHSECCVVPVTLYWAGRNRYGCGKSGICALKQSKLLKMLWWWVKIFHYSKKVISFLVLYKMDLFCMFHFLGIMYLRIRGRVSFGGNRFFYQECRNAKMVLTKQPNC